MTTEMIPLSVNKQSLSAQEESDPLSEEFLEYLGDGKNYSPQTLRSYRQALTQFRAFRPSVAWTAATADDFRAYLFDLMKRNRSRSTIRLSFAALRSFYNHLCERNIIPTNVLKLVSLPKLEKKLPQFLTIPQVTTLMEKPAEGLNASEVSSIVQKMSSEGVA